MKMTHRAAGFFAVWILLSGFVWGCAPVISSPVREQAVLNLSLSEVQDAPHHYRGKVVIWSGRILKVENKHGGTWLEILEHPADSRGKPKDLNRSRGRFLAVDSRFLDGALFAPGRLVTVAGEITGYETRPMGEITYRYPVLRVLEIYLWPEERYYYYDPWYDYPPVWWHFYYGRDW